MTLLPPDDRPPPNAPPAPDVRRQRRVGPTELALILFGWGALVAIGVGTILNSYEAGFVTAAIGAVAAAAGYLAVRSSMHRENT